ncbi:MAG: hypothetical protein V2I67_09695 [Thermoanaerobaculales bacterium]|nr:hypothetical protein [Thermoanaerobaculales bacterium]
MRSTSMLGTGMVLIGVPISVGYSYFCLRSAPDRAVAAVAFVLALGSLAGLVWFGWHWFA